MTMTNICQGINFTITLCFLNKIPIQKTHKYSLRTSQGVIITTHLIFWFLPSILYSMARVDVLLISKLVTFNRCLRKFVPGPIESLCDDLTSYLVIPLEVSLGISEKLNLLPGPCVAHA